MTQNTQQQSTNSKTKSWTLIREIAQFILTIFSIVISTFTLLDKIGDGTAQIKETGDDVKDIKKQVQIIREHLIAKGIINPGK